MFNCDKILISLEQNRQYCLICLHIFFGFFGRRSAKLKLGSDNHPLLVSGSFYGFTACGLSGAAEVGTG